MRKIENLTIDEVWINRHPEACPNGVLGIEWSANVGFGRFEIILDDKGVPHALTEYMDKGEDKAFTEAILAELLKIIVIDE